MEEGETTRQKPLLAFYKYLQLLGRKALSAKHAKQHVRQILNMLNAIDPDADDIVCLTDDQGLRVWKWAMPLLESQKKRPGTIISYLTSLEKFF